MAEGFKIAEAYVQVSPNTDGFKEELKSKLDEATSGLDAKVKVGLDTSELDAKADEAKAKVAELDGKKAEARAGLDSADLDAKADEAKAKIDELGGKTAKPRAGLDAADLDAKADDAKAKLDDLGAKKADPRVGLDTAAFDAKLDEAKARLDAFKAESANANLGASGGSGGGGGGGGGSIAGLLGMGGASLLPGIGGAATGLGLLGGTGALAFGGISQALSAAHQASQNVGITGAQQAATAFSNSVQMQNAQQQVSQAQQQAGQDSVQSAAQITQAQQQVGQATQQAAQDAITSAQSIESAQSNLASVVRNAAASQVQAEQAVANAQQGLETSNYGLTEAQYNLNQAWTQARLQITSLNDALANSKLNTQQAALAVKEAVYQQTLTNQNAYSTDLQRQQAALNVAQAQQQLTDAQDQQTASQIAANQANKQGVAGSQQVIQAKQGVVAAQYAQGNAQQAYANAQRQLTLVELNNASQVKQAQLALTAAQEQAAFTRKRDAQAVAAAQQNLAMAQEQAAYTQKRDAQTVANAQQNVTNTLKQQQLQQAATASTANQAANQFAKDMAKLTPAGRAFVDQILGMRGAFNQLQAVAQNAVLPGMTVFLTGIQKLMPTITAGIGKMGGVISGAFAAVGKVLATPAAAKALQGLIDNGVRFANIVLPAFGQFIGALAQIGSQKGAADGLANLLAGIARGMTGLTTALGPYVPQINSFLTAVGNIIAAIGPPLGRLVGLVATALGPLTRYLNAHPNGTVVKVIGDIVTGMLGLKALQKIIPDFITGPLGKLNEKLITGPLKNLGGKVGDALMSPFRSAAGQLPGIMGGAFDSIRLRAMYAWDGISGAAGKAWTGISGFGSKLGGMMTSAAGSVASFVADFGRKMGQAAVATGVWIAEHAVATATFVAENVVMAASATAAFIAENAASLGLVAAIAGIVTAIVFLATHWHQVWTDIKNWALDVWHNVLEPVFHGIGNAAMWLYNVAIKPYFQLIKTEFRLLATAGMWLWHNVFDPIWRGIVSGATWLYNNGIKPYFQLIKTEFKWLEDAAMWMWHNIFDPMWHGLQAGVQMFVTGFGRIWNTLKSIFKDPVNFLINTVYTHGIENLWNKVVGAIGLGAIKLPDIHGLAGGGVIPGYAPGHDTVPAMLSPGEAVLTPGAAQALGHGTVHALNAAYGPRGSSDGHHFAPGGTVPGPGRGGALGATNPTGPALGPLQGLAGGVIDAVKIAAAVATGNTAAFTNAAAKLIGTHAAGDLAKIMIGLPKTLVTDLVKQLAGMGGGGGAGGYSSVPAQSGSAAAAQKFAAAHLAQFGWGQNQMPPLISLWNEESGWNANATNASSGAYGIPQALGKGHPYNLGDYANQVLWGLNYIKGRYGSPAAAYAFENSHSPAWYDKGGWLMPGGMPVNGLSRPEAVLTPEESQAFVTIARHLASQGVGGASGVGSKQATFNYYGTQQPSAEQKAAMLRDLALALGGAS